MSKKNIGYFDLLGYKQFIQKNDVAYAKRRVEHILRDIETSLSLDELTYTADGRLVGDTSGTPINCINISDTIIFWTDDDSVTSCLELLEVCFIFNQRMNLYNFPLRGAIIHDDFHMVSGSQRNLKGKIYSPNIMYGKGLLNAHLLSEGQNWAGTIIDKSLFEQYATLDSYNEKISELSLEYNIPYKDSQTPLGYALKLTRFPVNPTLLQSLKRDIERTFRNDDKEVRENEEIKLKNTLAFLDAHPKDGNTI